jgi:serine protease AprX
VALDRQHVAFDRQELERWLFGVGAIQRRTQDSPILPDVWYAYALPDELDVSGRDTTPLVADHWASPPAGQLESDPEEHWNRRVDLLLRPHDQSSAASLAYAIASRIGAERQDTLLAWNDVYVAARLTFKELVADVLPLSRWWQEYLSPGHERQDFATVVLNRKGEIEAVYRGEFPAHEVRRAAHEGELSADLVWLIGIVGRISWEWNRSRGDSEIPTAEEVVQAAVDVLGETKIGPQPEGKPLWSVNRNRPVATSVWNSRVTTKADAATRLFSLSCRGIRWAVLDSGIDARHPAFARRDDDKPVAATGANLADAARSRIIATYDFSEIRTKLAAGSSAVDAGSATTPGAAPTSLSLEDPGSAEAQRVQSWVTSGRAVDWAALEGDLVVPHSDPGYVPPIDEHGTHVAGILAGDWRPSDAVSSGDHHVQGICPDIELYDLRVFGPDGSGDEFSILSAMQFVRYLNAHADRPVIHGVNCSFSVRHEVAKYAAGRTPVCEEAERLVGSGVVVVAAAGNDGRGGYVVKGRSVEGYRTVSITDPGNAESVITVGSTHRSQPHTYGVSYFSSRGPTGDGRAKPDLVAPGEKIVSAVPDAGLKSLDGTSQAAPHVSGVAALLLARHPELIGQPKRVKDALVSTCTDLGRDHSFQGAGVIDVLRAIQAI